MTMPHIPPIDRGGPAILTVGDLRVIDRASRRMPVLGDAGYHARLALMAGAAGREEERERCATRAHRAYIEARCAAGITSRAYA